MTGTFPHTTWKQEEGCIIQSVFSFVFLEKAHVMHDLEGSSCVAVEERPIHASCIVDGFTIREGQG